MKLKLIAALLFCSLVWSCLPSVYSIQDESQIQEKNQLSASGVKGEATIHPYENSGYIINNAPPTPFSIMERPTSGSASILAIPIQFIDVPYTTGIATIDARWDGSENSVRDYYLENSFGKLGISVHTLIYRQAPFPITYYAHDSYSVTREIELANWALDYWDTIIDYNDYNYIYIVYTGTDAQDNVHFWPHVWTWYGGSIAAGDGVSYDKLGFVGEFSSMGTYAHEFGHSLGLVDYYSYEPNYYPCGYWELMAMGNYNDGGTHPAHMGAYSKIELGWIDESETLTLVSHVLFGKIMVSSLRISRAIGLFVLKSSTAEISNRRSSTSFFNTSTALTSSFRICT